MSSVLSFLTEHFPPDLFKTSHSQSDSSESHPSTSHMEEVSNTTTNIVVVCAARINKARLTIQIQQVIVASYELLINCPIE